MKTKKIMLACFALCTGMLFAQVPTAGLLNSWEFNGDLMDGTGNGNDGTWKGTGPENYVKDRCGKRASALQFNGFDNYIEMMFSGPAGASARSLSFWMRSDNRNAGDQYVVRGIFNYGKFTTGVTGSRWEICHNYGCEGVGVDISHEYFTSPSTCVNDGKWHHIVVTHAANDQLNQARVYIDGILMPQPSVEAAYYPPGNPNCSPTSNTGINATDVGPLNPAIKIITIGSVLGSFVPGNPVGTPGRFYKGDLDDFYFYDRVLTPVEVAQLFAEKCELRPCITCHESTVVVDPPIDPKGSPLKMSKGADNTSNATGVNTAVKLSDKNIISLDQNVPNPFAESTVITYNVPNDFARAQLIFFSDKGIVIKTVEIKQKGAGSITVFADDLTDGMYAYNLIVDGVTIESKKMIKN